MARKNLLFIEERRTQTMSHINVDSRWLIFVPNRMWIHPRMIQCIESILRHNAVVVVFGQDTPYENTGYYQEVKDPHVKPMREIELSPFQAVTFMSNNIRYDCISDAVALLQAQLQISRTFVLVDTTHKRLIRHECRHAKNTAVVGFA